MPRKNQLADFGPEFSQLVLKVDRAFAEGADEFPIMFSTHKLVHSLRFRIYAYFNALRESGSRPDLTAMASGMSMRIAGTTLVLYRRGEDKESEALRTALGLEKGFADGPTTTGVEVATSVLSANVGTLAAIRARNASKKN